MFRDAYRRRRCIVPVDGFFEWKAIKGRKAKQPYAIAMKDGKPFGLGGLWENWKELASGEWVRTFAIITTPANELVNEKSEFLGLCRIVAALVGARQRILIPPCGGSNPPAPTSGEGDRDFAR